MILSRTRDSKCAKRDARRYALSGHRLPPAGECRVQDREAEATARDEAILAAIEAVARDTALSANSAQERASMVRQLCGNWELAFTSSPSFS